MMTIDRKETMRRAVWRRRGLGVGGVCMGLAGVGCDAQADPAYEGEPLISIHGSVEAPLRVGDVEVGILWLRPAVDPLDDGVECYLEFSGETPSACVAACGVPSCDDLVALEAWSQCASVCEGPDGLSNISIN